MTKVNTTGGELNTKFYSSAFFKGNFKIIHAGFSYTYLEQDFDAGKPNYGVVGNHPERLNLNYLDSTSRVE